MSQVVEGSTTEQIRVWPSGVDTIAQAVSISKEVFPGGVFVETEEDPEIAGSSYLVFNVSAEGDPGAIVAQRLDWHRKIADLGDDTSRLKLSVAVQE